MRQAVTCFWERHVLLLGVITITAVFCVLPAAAADSTALATAQHVTTSYGYALYGNLKYPANFTHFDYTKSRCAQGRHGACDGARVL